MSGKAVKLGGYQWKDEQPNVRKWKLWVIFHLRPSNSYFVSMKILVFSAEKGCPGSADGGHNQLLNYIYNRNLRWSKSLLMENFISLLHPFLANSDK